MNDERAEIRVTGWDHYSAVMLILILVVAPLMLFMPVGALLGARLAALLTVAPLGVGILIAPLLRYEVTADHTTVSVRRHVAGIVYRREKIETLNTWVQVWGTGDWGDADGWPGSHYCMIGQHRPYTQGTPVGSPRDARQLEQLLTLEIHRLRGTDGAA